MARKQAEEIESDTMSWHYPGEGDRGIVLDVDADPPQTAPEALKQMLRMIRNKDLICRGSEARDATSMVVPWHDPDARYWSLFGSLARVCFDPDDPEVPREIHAKAEQALRKVGDVMAQNLDMGADTLELAWEALGTRFVEQAVATAILDLDGKLFTEDARRDVAGRLSAMSDTYKFEASEQKALDLARDYLLLGLAEPPPVELHREPDPDILPDAPDPEPRPSRTAQARATGKTTAKAIKKPGRDNATGRAGSRGKRTR